MVAAEKKARRIGFSNFSETAVRLGVEVTHNCVYLYDVCSWLLSTESDLDSIDVCFSTLPRSIKEIDLSH
jgi:hypothetical protein